MATTGKKKQQRRQDFLKGATEVFATQGYSSSTVRDIAENIGVLSGSLYHYFESKEQMLAEILRTMLVELRGSYQGIELLQLHPRESLSRLMDVGFGALEHWQQEILILQNEFPHLVTKPSFSFVSEIQREIEQVWVRELSRGRDRAVFSANLDAQFAYRIIMGSILNAARWYRHDGSLTAKQLGKAHADFFLKAMSIGVK